ncbi:DedA family protein [Gordonia sp. PDNC005]|uniref:DedA family protein n=1 Tax=unclassified Gordonia (in: high G+C Gram-positive bacteria) TaxID=2657482 RepID=UPI0019660F12|nr:DedA family protein [Gordonia sp. PDNC005]QRY62300.1 DedA family protein [Gordonia sp. PDNC005]
MQFLTDQLTSWIDAAPAWAVYAITAGVVYIETSVVVVGVVVPSEGVLIAAGVVASIGSAHIGVLIVLSALAAIAGDWTGYWVGRGFGPRLSATRLGRRMTRRMIRARRQAPSPGDAIVAVASARWIGFVRSLIPLVAGARRMPFRRFAVASAIGAVSWTATVLLISWAVGATLGADVALMVAIGVGLLSLAFLIYRRVRQTQAT